MDAILIIIVIRNFIFSLVYLIGISGDLLVTILKIANLWEFPNLHIRNPTTITGLSSPTCFYIQQVI